MPDVATPQSWARDLADKIRAHDAANIDETEERRSLDLAALVRKSMSAVPPGLKTVYLDELDTHFPMKGAAQPAQPTAAKAENETAVTVIRRRLPELTDGERSELLRQLLNGAFRETHSSGRLGRLLLEAPRKLNVPATAPPPSIPSDCSARSNCSASRSSDCSASRSSCGGRSAPENFPVSPYSRRRRICGR